MGSSEEKSLETRPEVPDRPGLGRHLERRAVDRVLKRAVELQAAEHGGVDGLDEQQLTQIAEEIGIAPQHLRRALAEERIGLGHAEPRPGLGQRLLGPQKLTVGRAFRGDPRILLGAGAEWLEREESLRISRKLADGLSAEPDPRTLAKLRSALGLARGTGQLRKADSVVLRVERLDDAEVLVTATADMLAGRRRAAAGMGVLLALSIVLGVVAAAVFGPFAWVGVSMLGVALAAAWRFERLRELEAVERGLDRALDALGEPKPEPPRLERGVSGALGGARRLGKELRLLGEAVRDGLRPPKP
jgi:hypothetical protein